MTKKKQAVFGTVLMTFPLDIRIFHRILPSTIIHPKIYGKNSAIFFPHFFSPKIHPESPNPLGVSSPAKAAYVVETVEAELRGASNGTRWAAFAVGSCAPWMRDFFGKKMGTSSES